MNFWQGKSHQLISISKYHLQVYNGQIQKPEIVDILPSGVIVSYTIGVTNVSDGIASITATFI